MTKNRHPPGGADMRWALAGIGLGLEAVALAIYLLGARGRLIRLRNWRSRAILTWSAGALCVGMFALMDHDSTLLLGQGVICMLFIILVRRGGGSEN